MVLQGWLDDGLSFIGDSISNTFMEFVTFVLGFFPDGDPAINAAIDSWSFSVGGSTFNVLYFVDFGTVLLFVGLAVAIPFVVMALDAVKGTISTVNGVLDKLPFKIGS